jgi:hypothetical protein
MFDSAALDVAIGLALVYLLFALAVSKINEIITSFLGTRYVGLEKAITALIGDDSSSILSTEKVLSHDIVAPFTKAVNGTPRVDGVSFPGKRGVSYLPSRAFSAAVFDLLAAPQRRAPPPPTSRRSQVNSPTDQLRRPFCRPWSK